MNESCERIVTGHSVPLTQYILVLVNFIGNPFQKNAKHYNIKEDFKI